MDFILNAKIKDNFFYLKINDQPEEIFTIKIMSQEKFLELVNKEIFDGYQKWKNEQND